MKHLLTGPQARPGSRDATAGRTPRPLQGHVTGLCLTLDEAHATPLRRALTRDCADLNWAIRVTPIHGTDRVKFVLYLLFHHTPESPMIRALDRVKQFPQGHTYAPDAVDWRLLPGHALMGVPRRPAGPPTISRAVDSRAVTLASLLPAEHVLLELEVIDRESLFTRIAGFLAPRCGLPAAQIRAGLMIREALGTTGLGEGVAVPHCEIEGLHEAHVLYVRPMLPIPFGASDRKPVSDFVVLFVPCRSDMLQLLVRVAERFCNHGFRDRLRACTEPGAVCKVFADFDAMRVAGQQGHR